MPLDFNNAQNMRFTLSVQRELPGHGCSRAGTPGAAAGISRRGGGGQAGEIDLNAIPAQYLSTSRSAIRPTIDFLAPAGHEPFRRACCPGRRFNGATIARSQLLRPYPQFGNVRTFDDDGTSAYNSAQVKLEKRFTRGYTVLAAYTWSRFTERVFKLNPDDTAYEKRLVGVRRAASRRAERDLGAAVRPRTSLGEPRRQV